MAYQPKTMLDCGAYSAWLRRENIDLDAYIAFIKEHGSKFFSVVALDVIPGQGATRRGIEEGAAQSARNFTYMRGKGIDPIPVFHMGEQWHWLDKMLDQRIPYIGISPDMRASQVTILRWLDHCFTRITDKDGIPLCKSHGFGVTAHRIVRRYPWFSVDSTTWALSAANGNVLMPCFTKLGPDYSQPRQLRMSDRDRGGGSNSMLNLAPWDRRIVDEYFAKLDLTFDEVRNVHNARLRVNASYFIGHGAQLKAAPFPPSHRVEGIKPRLYSERVVDFDFAPPKVFLATMVSTQQQATVLTNLNAPYRLISYYHCGRYEAGRIDEYTVKGKCSVRMTGWRGWLARQESILRADALTYPPD